MSEQDPIYEKDLSQLARTQKLKKALWWAIGVHVAIVVAAILGLPHFKEEPLDLSQAVMVDLVAPTAENSAAPNKSKSNKPFVPKAKPVKEPPKPPTAQPEKPPAPVQSDASKKLDTIKKPEPPKPKPVEKKPEPVKKEPIKKAEEKVKIDKPKEKPKPKEEPKKETPKKSRDDGAGSEAEQKEFNSVLKNLLGEETAPDTPDGNPIDAPHDPETKVEGKAPVTSEVLALSEMDALKYQLTKCWNVPAGAMDAEDLSVDIRVQVNPDRTVKSAEIVDRGRYSRDSFFQAAADSARRAVFNPQCTPLALPPDKYNVWKTILIRFDPKEMFGG